MMEIKFEHSTSVAEKLKQVIAFPSLENARELENALRREGYSSQLLGRQNQMASIDAAAESDRGITERIANAFDASLEAARLLSGVSTSAPGLTPRVAAQRYLNPNPMECTWEPQNKEIGFGGPIVQFWSDIENAVLRYRKYQPSEGFVTALVRDKSLGIAPIGDSNRRMMAKVA
jgi:hypothetical protein